MKYKGKSKTSGDVFSAKSIYPIKVGDSVTHSDTGVSGIVEAVRQGKHGPEAKVNVNGSSNWYLTERLFTNPKDGRK